MKVFFNKDVLLPKPDERHLTDLSSPLAWDLGSGEIEGNFGLLGLGQYQGWVLDYAVLHDEVRVVWLVNVYPTDSKVGCMRGYQEMLTKTKKSGENQQLSDSIQRAWSSGPGSR
ncbi:hypothetical protein WAI453_003051 [Rhynchosporium graminicola]